VGGIWKKLQDVEQARWVEKLLILFSLPLVLTATFSDDNNLGLSLVSGLFSYYSPKSEKILKLK
jgi:hypothetical protein